MNVSPTITYRAIDPATYEPIFGQGQSNFISDLDAVAQAIGTRLRLFQSEWWAAQQDGLPLWQSILGVGGAARNQETINLAIVQRISATPYVVGINSIQSSFNSITRSFSFSAKVQTQFGVVALVNIPFPPSQVLPTT